MPAFGGVLVPQPILAVPFVTSATGAASLSVPVPTGIPPRLQLFQQSWLVDGAAAQGLAASNGLQGTHY